MKPDEQRIAIAEACGWTDCHKSLASNQEQEPHERCLIGNPPKGIVHRRLPDYLNDLNAMHEAEKVLSEKQWVQYEEEIRTVVLGGIRLVSQWTKADIHATAAQKAKAFLQTLGLWQPTPTQPQ
jgi:hypothetical protein